MVKPINIYYEPSQSCIAQGDDVTRRKKQGYYIGQGGCGTYRMNSPSKVTLTFEVDGEVKSQSVKSLIREAYNISRVGQKQADRFFEDVKSGNIELDFNPVYGCLEIV